MTKTKAKKLARQAVQIEELDRRIEQLTVAIVSTISYARAHLIDLGAAGDRLEILLGPEVMAGLNQLCPAPQLSNREWVELRTKGFRGLEKFQKRAA